MRRMTSRAWPATQTGTSHDRRGRLLPKFRSTARRRGTSQVVRRRGAHYVYPSPRQPTAHAFAQCRDPSEPDNPRPQFAGLREHLSSASTFRGCRTTCCRRFRECNRCSARRRQHHLLLQLPQGHRRLKAPRFAQNHGRSSDTQRCARRKNEDLGLP